ncbi:hypothetical protein KFL_000120200 [Klebsormidium nitens]|uniref:GST C-terminal domain-containing protein n=1 Tax=Klebsormidium nitens TaxID=105231 RepID=A0A1Y1HL58_KLENI|nr:hypothetical protein KFL_000120200 [Klebsormidium nitens]|eukprot:GAQ78372.1 hypothetical protein KFL_000120200 [Klebsormidium nitens]
MSHGQAAIKLPPSQAFSPPEKFELRRCASLQELPMPQLQGRPLKHRYAALHASALQRTDVCRCSFPAAFSNSRRKHLQGSLFSLIGRKIDSASLESHIKKNESAQAPRTGSLTMRARTGSEDGAGKPAASSTSPTDFSSYLVDAGIKAGSALFGKGLPPGLLIQTAEAAWRGTWKIMMSQLAPSNDDGSYKRPESAFRNRIEKGGRFPPEKGRYHLYAALTCPWAHRTLIVHAIKGLDAVVPFSIAVPGSSGLWEFASDSSKSGGATLQTTIDRGAGKKTLKEVYKSQTGGYDGRSTVPMLWDTKTKTVVNNESADIIEILNEAFNDWAAHPDVDLAPKHVAADISRWNDLIYDTVNNGVYKCGFATSQGAYDIAVAALFDTLDAIDAHLQRSRYLCGDQLTLADVRLFTTILRFDPVYYVHFKCSRQRISEYKYLYPYLRDMYQHPGVAATCDLDSICRQYYYSLFPLNPGGLVPVVPRGSDPVGLLQPHSRGKLLSSPVLQSA